MSLYNFSDYINPETPLFSSICTCRHILIYIYYIIIYLHVYIYTSMIYIFFYYFDIEENRLIYIITFRHDSNKG